MKHLELKTDLSENDWFFNDFEIYTFLILEPLEPPPWPILSPLGSLWAPLGLPLGSSWTILGSLGTLWGSPGAPWGSSWDQLGSPWPPLGAPGRPLGSTWLHLEHFELPKLDFDPPNDHFGAMLNESWTILPKMRSN
jgi:hypothetical protein